MKNIGLFLCLVGLFLNGGLLLLGEVNPYSLWGLGFSTLGLSIWLFFEGGKWFASKLARFLRVIADSLDR